jgi:hypothetical protein
MERDDDEYEMYRVSVNNHQKERAHTRFRLFGVPGLMNLGRIKTEVVTHVDRIPSSIPDIKAFIMREKDAEYTVPPTLNDLVNISPKISTAIYTLVNDRNSKPGGRPYYWHRNWNAEFLVKWEWWESKRFGRKQEKTEGYIVILRGRLDPPRPLAPGLMPGPPPPRARSPVRIIDQSPKLEVRKGKIDYSTVAAELVLTQQETEKVINDFLATFSTLYDGVPVEKRGAPLRGIDLKEVDEMCDYDSDGSSDASSWASGSRSSLVDD